MGEQIIQLGFIGHYRSKIYTIMEVFQTPKQIKMYGIPINAMYTSKLHGHAASISAGSSKMCVVC